MECDRPRDAGYPERARTGDVLALVSRPGFDPNLFGRGLTRAEFKALNDNIDHPLLNRALNGVSAVAARQAPEWMLASLVRRQRPSSRLLTPAAPIRPSAPGSGTPVIVSMAISAMPVDPRGAVHSMV